LTPFAGLWQDRAEEGPSLPPSRRAQGSVRAPRVRALLAGVALGAGLVAVWPAAPAGAVTTTFGFTGAQQTFVVPTGVTSVHVLAVGARGGNGLAPGGGLGGAPAEVSGDLEVLPGQTLYVEVGGVGTEASSGKIARGFNGGNYAGMGGAGGGGASDVRLLSRPENDSPASLFSRLIVAGGGGAGGDGSEGTTGGAGGQAGAAGAAGVPAGAGGGGATEEAGGIGECAKRDCDGKLGFGAEGAVGLAGSNGGGGGGGLFGGAGGFTNATTTGGGGGGGSSLQPTGGKTVIPAAATTPQVQITYTAPVPQPPKKPPPPHIESAFSLLRPVVGVGNSITLVLDLPGSGSAKALATASHDVFVKRGGKRMRKKVRFSFGTAHATITRSGALELVIKPSAAGKNALRASRRLTVAIVVSFTPAGVTPPPTASKRLSVTLTRR
jgi:hypothetical protein